jgi:hypothetical protein
MYAILLAAATLGQCGHYANYPPAYPTSYHQPAGTWSYRWFYMPTSPWNAAVAELRAQGKARSRDRFGGLPASTRQNLQDLSLTVEQLYATLRAAPLDQKAELRAQWITARRDLERARLLASRELP